MVLSRRLLVLRQGGRLRVAMMKRAAIAIAVVGFAWVSPALALDLNDYRAQNKRPRLSMSSQLSGIASGKARELAGKGRLDHAGFRERARLRGATSAENVAFGCDTEDCVIQQWARSGGHRSNMLLRNVSHYGLASAKAANGRRYWVLELGSE